MANLYTRALFNHKRNKVLFMLCVILQNIMSVYFYQARKITYYLNYFMDANYSEQENSVNRLMVAQGSRNGKIKAKS